MTTYRTNIVLGATILFACVACSSSTDSAPANSAPANSAPASSATAAAVDTGGSDFCDLYATQVSQGLVNLRTVNAEGVTAAEDIASELAAKAPVAQSELMAAAPPEPLGYLQAIQAADAAGSAGDLSAMDALFPNIVSLTDWSIAHCDAKYSPIFTEYKGVIG